MFRKSMLAGVGLMAAAVMLIGTPDSAWARRCRGNGGYGYQSGYYYGTNGYSRNNGYYYGNNWNNGGNYWGTTTNVAPVAATPGTVTTQPYATQPYSTGYGPQRFYDNNGRWIDNGTQPAMNPQQPANMPPAQPPAQPAPNTQPVRTILHGVNTNAPSSFDDRANVVE